MGRIRNMLMKSNVPFALLALVLELPVQRPLSPCRHTF